MASTEPPYRLDDTTADILTLPDGRKLGYAEYGLRTGQAILYMHGFPASRIEGAGIDHVASQVGARIIAIDRPGMGLSTPHPTRTLLDHARDVEALANHLQLRRYGVLGISGGGPYALACAKALPADQLRVVSIVCGLGSPDMGYWGMFWLNWAGWAFGQRWLPGLCRWWFGRESAARLDLSREERMKRMRHEFEKGKASIHPKDRSMLGSENFMRMHLVRSEHVFANGTDGMAQDFKLLNEDFGFKIEDIRKDLPVQLWYGKLDGNVPLQHGQKIAARLGANATLRVEDETHASIWANWKEEYLSAMVKALEADA